MSLRKTLSILVVDDMATSRGLITQALDEIGIAHYYTENSGKDALKTLSSKPTHLVLSDYNMPEMDGLSLLQLIRRSPTSRKIGFILVTGRPTAEIVSTGKKLGLNNLIKKPFSTVEMKKCIEKVVGKL